MEKLLLQLKAPFLRGSPSKTATSLGAQPTSHHGGEAANRELSGHGRGSSGQQDSLWAGVLSGGDPDWIWGTCIIVPGWPQSRREQKATIHSQDTARHLWRVNLTAGICGMKHFKSNSAI